MENLSDTGSLGAGEGSSGRPRVAVVSLIAGAVLVALGGYFWSAVGSQLVDTADKRWLGVACIPLAILVAYTWVRELTHRVWWNTIGAWAVIGSLAVLAAALATVAIVVGQPEGLPNKERSSTATFEFPGEPGRVHVWVKPHDENVGRRHVVLLEWGGWRQLVKLEGLAKEGKPLVTRKNNTEMVLPLKVTVEPQAVLEGARGDVQGGLNIEADWEPR